MSLNVANPLSPGSGGRVLEVKWLVTLPEIESMEFQWRQLENSVFRRTVFSTFDYIIPWYRHYAGNGFEQYGTPLVGVVRNGNDVVAIAPFTAWRGTLGNIPVRKIDLAGFNAEAGEILVRDDCPAAVACILEGLFADNEFDVVCLCGLDPDSDHTKVIRDFARERGIAAEDTTYRYAIVDLSDGYDAYHVRKGKNFRRNLKRQTDRISQEGTIAVDSCRWVQDGDSFASALSRAFAISDRSWKVKEGGRLTDHHRRFFEEVAYRFGRRGMIDLSILSIGSRDAAYMLSLVERGTLYDVTVSYDKEFKKLGPGYFLMFQVIRSLPESGIRTIISHGDHPYKERWATGFVPQCRIFLFNRGVRPRLGRLVRFAIPKLLTRHCGTPLLEGRSRQMNSDG